jgi:protein required for attachment to host cells
MGNCVIQGIGVAVIDGIPQFAETALNSKKARCREMTAIIPHNALIVVADGTGARLFRNTGKDFTVELKTDGEFKPSHLSNDGPAGHRPPESSGQETDEATFAKQLAKELYRRAHSGDYEALVLIADPQTLGQIRPSLHKEVRARLVSEIGKTLTNSSIADIQKAMN